MYDADHNNECLRDFACILRQRQVHCFFWAGTLLPILEPPKDFVPTTSYRVALFTSLPSRAANLAARSVPRHTRMRLQALISSWAVKNVELSGGRFHAMPHSLVSRLHASFRNMP